MGRPCGVIGIVTETAVDHRGYLRVRGKQKQSELYRASDVVCSKAEM